MAAGKLCLAFILCFCAVLATCQPENFVYNGFNDSDLDLDGANVIKPIGAIRLTNNSQHVIGHAFYPKPIPMLSSVRKKASSFSTCFVFQIAPSSGSRGGYGLAFTLSPAKKFTGAQSDHYMGILNSSNEGKPSNHIFMVEFDTVNGFNGDSDTEGNHVGININSMDSIASKPAAYFVSRPDNKNDEEVFLEGPEPIQAWIEYDGENKLINVTVSPKSVSKPNQPLISVTRDLTDVVEQNMYAGFSAATGSKTSSHYILGWSFRLNGSADPLNLSKLPVLITYEAESSSTKSKIKKVLISAFSVIAFFSMGAMVSVAIYRRVMRYESLEEWELDCPHRFRYRDLHSATGGFKESAIIGVGGFGEVYKGVLPNSAAEIAVKRISNHSLQGIREFAAEIESLGRLSHKNLVNLQGWCKQKNDLLVVYDYIPNGNLDSLLSNPRIGFVLSWEQRFNIVRGIAAGLLYLHEEWEQVVIHRDVKSSNVLIDADLNARLGDFGLARLYDHGKNSHTTNVVGTIGYIAPELTRTGRASTSSDVYAYGILLMEVACGRRPITEDPDHDGPVILTDWVIEFLQTGRISEAADPRLSGSYPIEEMILVLQLGLICSHPKPEARPTMRHVVRYLNGDEMLPAFEESRLRVDDEFASRFWEEISADDQTYTSYRAASIGQQISSSSSVHGR